MLGQGKLEGGLGVLLGHENADACSVQGREGAMERRDYSGRQARRGFIKKKEARLAHGRLADGDHLLCPHSLAGADVRDAEFKICRHCHGREPLAPVQPI